MPAHRDVSERSLTTAYLAALGLVALLTTASYITLDKALTDHEGSAAIINASGRQRMLSQRIASLAAQYRLGSPTARADLVTTINQFEAAHNKLLGDAALLAQASPDAAALRRLYSSGDKPLDGEIASYIALARHVADTPQGAPALDANLTALFEEARSPLLTRLNEVVELHQKDSEAETVRFEWLQGLALGVILITLVSEALLIFRPMVRRITCYANELLLLATTDPLTGSLNRASFFERGEGEVARARRTGRPTAVLMLDADHFKAINDRYGHAGGDAALQGLASTLRRLVRAGDLVGRLGGEEFAVLLPETDPDAASEVAERLRSAIANLVIDHGSDTIRLTVSIGVAAGRPDQAELTALLREADMALYGAKSTGRNRIATKQDLLVMEDAA